MPPGQKNPAWRRDPRTGRRGTPHSTLPGTPRSRGANGAPELAQIVSEGGMEREIGVGGGLSNMVALTRTRFAWFNPNETRWPRWSSPHLPLHWLLLRDRVQVAAREIQSGDHPRIVGRRRMLHQLAQPRLTSQLDKKRPGQGVAVPLGSATESS